MHQMLPHFRSPAAIAANNAFLCETPQKPEVLRMLSSGLHGH